MPPFIVFTPPSPPKRAGGTEAQGGNAAGPRQVEAETGTGGAAKRPSAPQRIPASPDTAHPNPSTPDTSVKDIQATLAALLAASKRQEAAIASFRTMVVQWFGMVFEAQENIEAAVEALAGNQTESVASFEAPHGDTAANTTAAAELNGDSTADVTTEATNTDATASVTAPDTTEPVTDEELEVVSLEEGPDVGCAGNAPLRNRVSILTRENDDLRAQLAAERRETKDLRGQLAVQGERLVQLRNAKEVKTAQAAAAYKKTRKVNTEKMLDECASAYGYYAAEWDVLLEKHVERRTELEEVCAERDHLKRVVEETDARLREGNANASAGGLSANAWQSRHDRLANATEKLRVQLEVKEGEATALQKRLTAATAAITNLRAVQASAPATGACAQCAAKDSEAAALRARVASTTRTANEQIQRGVAEVKGLLTKLKAAGVLAAHWEDKAGRLQAELEEERKAKAKAKAGPAAVVGWRANAERKAPAEAAALRAGADASLADVLAQLDEQAARAEKHATAARIWQSKYDKLRMKGNSSS